MGTHLKFVAALKLYLRELPTPLLGQDYDRWISECGIKDERKKESMDSILSGLPQSHRHNLHYILKFLQLVASHSSVNKMTPANISIVLAPNLLWNCQTDANDQHDLSQTNLVNDIVEHLIENVDFFFRGFGSGNMDFFKEVTLEKPKHMLRHKTNSNGGGEDSGVEGQRTPVPKPRQSKAINVGKVQAKGPPPPLAPRPALRTPANSTHL